MRAKSIGTSVYLFLASVAYNRAAALRFDQWTSVLDRPGKSTLEEHTAGKLLTIDNWPAEDVRHMARALELARHAESAGEVPVGAVLVSNGIMMGEGWNRPCSSNDPTSHAEIEALRQAARALGNYRLNGAALYVTLEPCVMCAGALVLARIKRLVFAARDLRFGAVRSKFRLADSDLLNYRINVEEGLFAAESGRLLTAFFASRRQD